MLYFVIFLLGIAFGSFANALEWRVRHKVSLWDARSKCPSCQKTLRWFHLIPVASFLALRGKCAFCNAKISWQYPLVELWMGVAFVFLAYWNGPSTVALRVNLPWTWQCVAVFFLTLIFIYDYKYQEIPDKFTLPAISIFLVYLLADDWQKWPSVLIGASIGGGVFLIQYLISKGKWIGGGDIRLGVLMGIILGFPNILLALFLAYVAGALWAAVLLLRKKKRLNSEIAFGTFLTVATLFTMVWGEDIIHWYLKMIGW